MTFELDIIEDQNGNIKFGFDTIFISDIHFGTKHCKAKLLYQFLNYIDTNEMHLVGDIIDGWHMTTKDHYNLGPFHRQSMAQIMRLTNADTRVIYEVGNHDETLRGKPLADGRIHRQMTGKNLFGIEIEDHTVYVDPTGRRFYVTHGDEFDPEIYKSDKGLAYKAGDLIISSLGDFDCWAENTFSKEFRAAASAKRAFKVIEERVMPNLKNAEQKALKENFDGVVFGHSHLRGFKKTKSGVVLINDGCSTDDGIEFAAVDKKGNWAIIKWNKEGLRIRPEHESEYVQKWSELGVKEKIHHAEPIVDEATYNIDRLQRVLYRLWPPKERQKSMEEVAIIDRPLPIPLSNPKFSR